MVLQVQILAAAVDSVGRKWLWMLSTTTAGAEGRTAGVDVGRVAVVRLNERRRLAASSPWTGERRMIVAEKSRSYEGRT
jgi:hypothetical protein